MKRIIMDATAAVIIVVDEQSDASGISVSGISVIMYVVNALPGIKYV